MLLQLLQVQSRKLLLGLVRSQPRGRDLLGYGTLCLHLCNDSSHLLCNLLVLCHLLPLVCCIVVQCHVQLGTISKLLLRSCPLVCGRFDLQGVGSLVESMRPCVGLLLRCCELGHGLRSVRSLSSQCLGLLCGMRCACVRNHFCMQSLVGSLNLLLRGGVGLGRRLESGGLL